MKEEFSDPCQNCDGRNCETCEYYSEYYSQNYEDEEDFSFLGSFLEAQLIRDGQELCPVCKKKISSILVKENPNLCKEKIHEEFKRLFDIRIQIGLHDLKTRGYD